MALQYFQQYSKKSATLLLDLYPGAVFALSLRKLRTAYEGACIRVRNSLGNEQDIGFVGNVIDVATLTTFLNGQSGTIVVGYDQSLIGNNATQPVLTNQPICVLSDAELNNRPSMSFAGNDYFSFPTLFTPQTDCTVFFVSKAVPGVSPVIGDSTAGSYSTISHWYGDILIQGVSPGNTLYSPDNATNYGYTSCMLSAGTNKKVYKNGIQLTGTPFNQLFRFNELGRFYSTYCLNGNIADIIVYPNLQNDACRLKFEADARTDYNLP